MIGKTGVAYYFGDIQWASITVRDVWAIQSATIIA